VDAEGANQGPEAAAAAGLGAEVLQEMVGGHELNISRRGGAPEKRGKLAGARCFPPRLLNWSHSLR
jgi:hypothetical protein